MKEKSVFDPHIKYMGRPALRGVSITIMLCSLILLPNLALAKQKPSGYWATRTVDKTKYVDNFYEQDNYGREKIKIFVNEGQNIIVDDGEIYFNLNNHLDSTSLIVDENGQAVEANEYSDFGKLIFSDSEIRNNDKFLGQPLDSETNLSYLQNRYYDSSLARFMSIDPLLIFNPNMFISDPQQLNNYSYARNNPISNLDPTGLLTVVIPGTWYNSNDWSANGGQANFLSQVNSTFNDNMVVINDKSVWSGGDNDIARQSAADIIAEQINNYRFVDGENLNIVGHSHGGNVANLITGKVGHTVNNLVTLGTPVISGYSADRDNVENQVNVYSLFDAVQKVGGNQVSASAFIGSYLGSVFGPSGAELGFRVGSKLVWAQFGIADNKVDGSTNINITSKAWNPFTAHGSYFSPGIWSLVDKNINK